MSTVITASYRYSTTANRKCRLERKLKEEFNTRSNKVGIMHNIIGVNFMPSITNINVTLNNAFQAPKKKKQRYSRRKEVSFLNCYIHPY